MDYIPALVVVLLLFDFSNQEVTPVEMVCSNKCRSTIIHDRAKCLLRCRKEAERFQRSSNRIKRTPNTKIQQGDECYKYGGDIGVRDPYVKIHQIEFKFSNNTRIARVIWDPHAECIEKPNLCQGYFVICNIDMGFRQQYCTTINKDVNYIDLDESLGYDGRRSFAIIVKAFPFLNSELRREFPLIKPPLLVNKSDRVTLTFTTSKPTTLFAPDTTTNISSTVSSNKKGSSTTSALNPRQADNPGDKITMIFSLSVFTVVLIATLGIVVKWIYRKFKPSSDPVPISGYNQMIKGTIYVSYLPEKTTVNQVFGICSWLKSHSIDVVMDQMYDDQKLYNSLGPKRFGEKFLVQADKVIMVVTPGYLRLCNLDDTVDIDSMPCFNTLNEERIYSEVAHIKNELSTTLRHGPIRFIPVLVDVPDDYLPRWLQKLTSVKWPEDGKTKTFLNLLKGDDLSAKSNCEEFVFA